MSNSLDHFAFDHFIFHFSFKIFLTSLSILAVHFFRFGFLDFFLPSYNLLASVGLQYSSIVFILNRFVVLFLTLPTVFYRPRYIVAQPIVPSTRSLLRHFFSSNLFISIIDILVGLRNSSSISFLIFIPLSFNYLYFNSLKSFSYSKILFFVFRILFFS